MFVYLKYINIVNIEILLLNNSTLFEAEKMEIDLLNVDPTEEQSLHKLKRLV